MLLFHTSAGPVPTDWTDSDHVVLLLNRAMAERAYLQYDAAMESSMDPLGVENLMMVRVVCCMCDMLITPVGYNLDHLPLAPTLQAIKQLQCERPYFLPPVYEKERVHRAQVGLIGRGGLD